MKKNRDTDNHEEIDLKRRKALAKLGLVASAVYAAPVLMTLSQSAHAASAPSVPGTTSAPSVASTPSVASAPSTSAPSVSAPSTSAPSVSAPSVSAPSAPSVSAPSVASAPSAPTS